MTRAAFGVSGESVRSSFGQTSSALASCALMADLMGSGVLVLDRRGEPLFANALARKLLIGTTAATDERTGEDLSGSVKNLLSLLDAMVGGIDGEHPPARAAVPWPSPQSFAAVVSGACTPVSTSLQIEVSPLAGDPRRGYVVVLNDGGTATQLADELLTASRMRSRDYIYHALLHDLRAPLNALEINLELLVDNCAHAGAGHVLEEAGQQPGQGLRQMGQGLLVLREELARLNRTLRVVLDGGELFRPLVDNFDLAEALREVALLLSPQARQQHVVIQLQFPDHAVLVDGHRDRLKQAFINVAVNALEAMQDGGRLVIAIERAQGSVRIRFTDDGGGIPAVLRERVFDVRFTTKPGGNGMGLFVARLVANAHGGEVRIDGGAGAGCAIEFMLPLAGGSPQA